MALLNTPNPRKEGEFVTEKRCSCPTSQLYAIKFNKVQCKVMSQCNKNCEIFCYAFLYFIILFGPLALLIATHGSGLTIIYISFALYNGTLIIIVTMAYAAQAEFTHTALEVLYKCRSCGHEMHVTYEVLRNARRRSGGDIFNAYGRYTRTCQEPEPLSLKTTAFDDVERAYRTMRPHYDHYHNSLYWTRQMIKRLR